jgi:hypothetical protein
VTFLGAVGGNTIAAVIVALTLQRWLERKSKDET